LPVALNAASSDMSASAWRAEPLASRIFGMFQKPTIPFSIQNRTRIVSRLQPKNSTPMSGIALAIKSATAERSPAVRR
jgi:hypothetical protein